VDTKQNARRSAAGSKDNNQPPDPHCLLADASVFLGTTSMPLGQARKFVPAMKEFFENYRNRTAGMMPRGPSRSEFIKCFYRPTPYFLFGAFDLAFLALIEDFEFPVQTFNSFDPGWPKKRKMQPFAHRVTIGPCPSWDDGSFGEGEPAESAIVTLAKNTFLCSGRPGSRPKMPLLGICRLEVNNSFLIGGGSNYLRSLVKAIRSCFDEHYRDKRDKNMHVIILESFSWHELTVLIFSNSYAKILDFVMSLREMTLLDVGYYLCRQQFRLLRDGSLTPGPERTAHCRAEWQELLRLGDLYSLDPRPRGTSARPFAADLRCPRRSDLKKEQLHFLLNVEAGSGEMFERCREIPPFGTHVLFNSTTSLGYDINLLLDVLNGRKIAQAMDQANVDRRDAQLHLVRHWLTKAGHLGTAVCMLDPKRTRAFKLTSGRSDFVFPCTNGASLGFERQSSRQLLSSLLDSELAVKRWQTANPHHPETTGGLLAAQSTVAFDREAESGDPPDGHCSADHLRTAFACQRKDIWEVFSLLKQMQVPKVVSERVLNIVALFNEGIRDNFLFSSFLELGPYSRLMLNYLRNVRPSVLAGKVLPSDLADHLNQLVDNLERGWRNRFHGTWRLGDISDFNLEFKGGIQQLVSAFHGAYRLLSSRFTGERRALAIVTGRPGIQTIAGAVELNLFDIFQPQFFAARAGHEAAETLFEMARDEGRLRRAFAKSLTPRDFRQLRDLLRVSTATIDSDYGDLILDACRQDQRFKRFARDYVRLKGRRLPKFFGDVYADTCNFRAIFLNRHDLYSFWWLASFVGDQRNWISYDQIHGFQLREVLLRMFLAMRCPGPGSDDDEAAQAVNRYWRELETEGYSGGVDEAIGEMSELSLTILRLRELEDWFGAAGRFAVAGMPFTDVLKHPHQVDPVELDVIPLDTAGWFDVDMRRLLPEARSCLLDGKALKGGAHRSLLNARGLERNYELDRWYDFCATIALLHSYLDLLKKWSECSYGNGRSKQLILRRDSNGEVVPPSARNCSKLLFDPRGGCFTFDPKFRRDYFRLRCALVMSLYDLTEKAKLVQCRRRLEQRAVNRTAQ
jgi:hypothetical protein